MCSLWGCFWLVYRLRQHCPRVRARLFPRQLHSLALADILFHLTGFACLTMDFFPLPKSISPSARDRTCHLGYIFFRAARFTCSLHETHIALSFVVQTFRLKSIMHLLEWHMIWIWILGSLLALDAEWSNPWTYDDESGMCKPVTWKSVACMTTVFVLVFCTIISLFAYVCVVLQSSFSSVPPEAVKVRNFKRARGYLLNAILTYGLIMVAYCHQTFFTNLYFFGISSTMEFYNGLFNSMTYACQSRYAAAELRSVADDACLWQQEHQGHRVLSVGNSRRLLLGQRTGGSFRVGIGGVDIIDILHPESIHESITSQDMVA